MTDKFENNELSSVLDGWEKNFNSMPPDEAVEIVINDLREIRQNLNMKDWSSFSTKSCRNHPLISRIHRDPFTKRAYDKPRGYPGDAKLLDYIYSLTDDSLPVNFDELEEDDLKLHRRVNSHPAASSVRERRNILAERLEETSLSNNDARIVSIACGHLREALNSESIMNGKFGKFTALDMDERSLDVVKDVLTDTGGESEVIDSPIKNILNGTVTFKDQDLVYAAGLYDYLQDPVASKLTTMMFEMLRPGGKVIVANYLPGIPDAGYMEAYMDWWLIYRDKEKMLQLVESGIEGDIEAITTFTEPNENIIFLEITRK